MHWPELGGVRGSSGSGEYVQHVGLLLNSHMFFVITRCFHMFFDIWCRRSFAPTSPQKVEDKVSVSLEDCI